MAKAYKRKLELDFDNDWGDSKRRKLQEKLDYLHKTIDIFVNEWLGL